MSELQGRKVNDEVHIRAGILKNPSAQEAGSAFQCNILQ